MVNRRKFITSVTTAIAAPLIVGSASRHRRRLLHELVAFWPLDEASGTRADKFGRLDLTDNNTVTQRVGPTGVGNAADFLTANSEYLSRASESLLQAGDYDFSFAAWAIIENQVGVVEGIIGKDVAVSRDYYLYYDGTRDLVSLQLYNTAGGVTNLDNSAPDTDWHLYSFGYRAATRTVWLAFDANAAFEATLAGATPPNAGTAEFRLGAREYATFQQYLDGGICNVGKWHRYLTLDDRQYLYSAGSGRAYPF